MEEEQCVNMVPHSCGCADRCCPKVPERSESVCKISEKQEAVRDEEEVK